MVKRRVVRRVEGRRTVAGSSSGGMSLDDRPLALRLSQDGKRLLATIPYGIVIFDLRDGSVVRRLELKIPHPTVAEDADGGLWIGGTHLHRGSSWGDQVEKVGSRLGGFVDRVALVHPFMLCGVGSTGEMLYELEKDEVTHRRKVSERTVHDLVATPDARAVFADGTQTAWVVDPAHPSGYAQIKLKATSQTPVRAEGIVKLAVSQSAYLVLASRDGAVAWTKPDLRIAQERIPEERGARRPPLDIAVDKTHIYVLRGAGQLQRFLIRAPKPPQARKKPGAGGRPKPAEQEAPPALAEVCRLSRPARCLLLAGEGEERKLILGGSHADGMLGRIWETPLAKLEWEELALGARTLVEPEPEPTGKTTPDFTAKRSKFSGPALSSIKVDDIIGSKVKVWATTSTGPVLDRPTLAKPALDDLLPGDALILAAMIRMKEGTARPALLLWPGVPEGKSILEPQWLTWGDKPAGWMVLDTPEIREQRWDRSSLFPMQVALALVPDGAPGLRERLPKRWLDPEGFAALALECKKAMKVLW